ncbi:MAG: hypothetical protein NT027_10310 [Proteobacteria bacterium]|nr:hypothetical protein [Pseudomonadota bacterium]
MSLTLANSCRTTSSSASNMRQSSPSSSASKTHKIKEIRCRDNSGDRELKISRSNVDLPFLAYNVEFKFRGRVVSELSNAPIFQNEANRFSVQLPSKDEDDNAMIVTAGVLWDGSKAEGFYQQAANNGGSPLPAAEFESCAVVEDATANGAASGPRKIQDIRCVDDTGDRVMTIKKSENELSFPSFHISFSFRGQNFAKVTDAPVTVNDGKRFTVEKSATVDDEPDTLVTAGVEWSANGVKGFYQQSANGGASPLPATELPFCSVTQL